MSINLCVGGNIYKYQLLSKLGNGSFGEVWLAKDNTINKNVALKILPASFEGIAKILDEARIGNITSHANLLQIYYADVTLHENKTPVVLIAQEYHSNGTVERLLNAHNFLPLPTIIKILKDILSGLDYLHHGGVFHNDIKPGNILIDSKNNGILSDYGISGVSIDGKAITAKNSYIIHSAPETLDKDDQIDVLTDIYQVGCTAYRLANGISEIRNEFISDSERFLAMKSAGKIPSKKHQLYVPKKLCQIINKAVDMDPTKRFKSTLEMRRSLEKLNYAGYWTSDPLDSSELIGIGNNYIYKYKISATKRDLFDFIALKENKNGTQRKISAFCRKGLSGKDKDKITSNYFRWVIDNAQ